MSSKLRQANNLDKQKKRARVILRELEKLFPDTTKTMLTYKTPWELLVAVILSAQCTDKQVNKVTEKLFKKYRAFTDYLRANSREFEQDIKSTGFYRNKAKNILAAARVLNEKFNGKIPYTIAELTTLPGVGRKTANVVLWNVYGIAEGIAVDTHVRRLSKFFGLTDENDPQKIEQDLMRILPPSEWSGFTYRIIEYGRKFQTARTKNVDSLPLTAALKRAGL